MARKKTKTAATGKTPDVTLATEQAAEQTPMQAQAQTGDTQRGMPYSTAILAIILAFVLGAVVGSVVPQLLQPQKAVVAQAPAPAAPQQNAPAQTASPQQGHDMHVIQDLEKQLAKDPANRKLYVALGNACFDAHLHERAIQAYEKALELDPKDADVLTDVGIMYRETGAFDTALARFRQAQAVDPGHNNAAFNEGVVLYYDLNSKKEALARWQRLLDANPAAVAPNGKPLADLIREHQ